jgi:hypothetical protein
MLVLNHAFSCSNEKIRWNNMELIIAISENIHFLQAGHFSPPDI